MYIGMYMVAIMEWVTNGVSAENFGFVLRKFKCESQVSDIFANSFWWVLPVYIAKGKWKIVSFDFFPPGLIIILKNG
jgi:hypothetical protein